jgi:hypothetical protein
MFGSSDSDEFNRIGISTVLAIGAGGVRAASLMLLFIILEALD